VEINKLLETRVSVYKYIFLLAGGSLLQACSRDGLVQEERHDLKSGDSGPDQRETHTERR
jgi:hypothetical protein